jgi:HPt (histidine-containing phosphotransfer) domain-containing protein
MDASLDPDLAGRRRIDGLDLEEGLRRFGGDVDTLLVILRSFARNTPALLERARLPDRENLKEYTTVVHGIKGSSYGICAPALGKMAEHLEHEAKLGNMSFIEANNGAFLQTAEKLLADLEDLLKSMDEEKRKETRDEPDASVLQRLRAACANYDMDGVDAAMTELERFTYVSHAELAVWLREQVDRMNFQEIIDRLPA